MLLKSLGLGLGLLYFTGCTQHIVEIDEKCSYGTQYIAPYTLETLDKAYNCEKKEKEQI